MKKYGLGLGLGVVRKKMGVKKDGKKQRMVKEKRIDLLGWKFQFLKRR